MKETAEFKVTRWLDGLTSQKEGCTFSVSFQTGASFIFSCKEPEKGCKTYPPSSFISIPITIKSLGISLKLPIASEI